VKTDELIVQLAGSARPIRPLPPPGVRSVRWFAAALAVMTTAVVLIGPRDDLTVAISRPVFLGSLAALLLTLASGASAAFALSVPGAERSPARRAVPLLAVGAWAAMWLVALFAVDDSAGTGTAAFHLACAIEITLCALATGWLLLAMIVRAAPLRPLWTAAVATLASMAAGAVVAQVLCPLDDPRHYLIGHIVVALVVMVTGLLVGRQALETRSRH